MTTFFDIAIFGNDAADYCGGICYNKVWWHNMGIYVNPGNENFKETLSGKIYVDKTMMISVLNEFMQTGEKYICISRPRRFGKTIAGNMISAYYSRGCNSKELFAPYKIANDESFLRNLNKYNVIKLDINSEYRNVIDKDNLIIRLTQNIRAEMQKQYSEINFDESDSIADCILKVFVRTSIPFVIILDEYDVLVRENVSDSLFAQYLDLLNGLFKSDTLRPAIALAYLTGILPIVRDKVQSKLNNFDEYTMLDAGELSEFVGFTSDETKALCDKYGVDFEECRRWYDGYRQHGFEIYNPESVVKSIRKKDFSNYWSKTSSYEVISDRIRQNFEGTKEDVVQMLSGESVDVNVTRYLNTMTSFGTRGDLFTYLIHLGYLAYNRQEKTCYIPNKEVRQEWFNAIETDAEYSVTNKIIQSSKSLLTETLQKNSDAVAKALDISHIHVTSNRSYNNEDALQSAIYLAYIYALNKYTVIKEMTTGKGFADVVFIPFEKNLPAIIIELKRNGSAESALKQIKEKQYFDSLNAYSGNLLFVGINYDENSKTHTCNIEEFQK